MRFLLAAALLAACGPAGRNPSGTADAPPADIDAPPFVGNALIYAHSGTVLYAMDPATLAATQIGSMAGLDSMRSLLDLAVDRAGGIVGVSREKLYEISSSSGALTLIGDLSAAAQGFTSLSYAPMNPNDPASPEILISANDEGEVYKFDLSGVQVTAILMGNYGTSGGQQIRSSGDVVAVTGLGIFATVDVGDDPDAPDYLAKIEPSDAWKATILPQSTGFTKIFGLGFWGGKFYGFVDNGVDTNGTSLGGRMIQIDPVTGEGTEISAADIRWYGAGVTTAAPIL